MIDASTPRNMQRRKSAIALGLLASGLGLFILIAYRLEASFLIHEGRFWATSGGLLLISSALCSSGILTLVLRRYSLAALLTAIFFSLILGTTFHLLEGENIVNHTAIIYYGPNQSDDDEAAKAFLEKVSPARLKDFSEDVAIEFGATHTVKPPSPDFDSISEIQHYKLGQIKIVFTDFPPNNTKSTTSPVVRNQVTAYARFLLEFEAQKARFMVTPSGNREFNPFANDLDREVKILCDSIRDMKFLPVGPFTPYGKLIWLANREPDPEVKQYLLELHDQMTGSSKP